VCSSYVHGLLSSSPSVVKITRTQKADLKIMARLLARGRAISIREWPDEDIQNYQVESPFRIISQLQSLVVNLARVHLREEVTDHEIAIVRRVVFSTLPQNRASVLGLFQDPANLSAIGSLTVKRCATGVGLSDKGAERLLKGLKVLNVLEVDASKKEHEYRPRQEFSKLLTVPVQPLDHIADLAVPSSEDRTDPSRTEPPIGQANILRSTADDH